MPIFGLKKTASGKDVTPAAPDASAGSKKVDESAAEEGRVKGLRQKQDAQQLKTFTRWWNSWLAMRSMAVTDLCEEIKPGVISMNLIELLSASLAGKYNKKPNSKFQMLENQNLFLALLKSKNIRLVNIGGEDLVEGNQTLVLGLTWTLILRYEIQKYGAEVDELLRWVRLCTKNYEGVEVNNWKQSFNDRLAFCALINKHSPQVGAAPPGRGAEPDIRLGELRKHLRGRV